MLGIKVAASTVWEILKAEGIDPAPDRSATTWAEVLCSQANALVAVDFMETITLTGQRQYILAAIEHATRRVRVLGTTAHPTAAWVIQAAKNLAMDLEDANATVKYLIRDRDAKYPALFDQVLADTGIEIVLSGIRVPRMNSIIEGSVRTGRHEMLDRTLIWNENHLRHAVRQFETHHNRYRPHQAMGQATPLRPVPEPITGPGRPPGHTPQRPTRRPSMSTSVPPDLYGRGFRQAHGHRCWPGRGRTADRCALTYFASGEDLVGVLIRQAMRRVHVDALPALHSLITGLRR